MEAGAEFATAKRMWGAGQIDIGTTETPPEPAYGHGGLPVALRQHRGRDRPCPIGSVRHKAYLRLMSDEYDRLSDEALLGYLTGAAAEREERLVIEQRDGEWFAESRTPSGLGGEIVVLGANGPDRRTAMLRLAHLFAD